MNRPGMAGFRKRAPKKKKADEEEVLTPRKPILRILLIL
jgi:hypothetical protein